jgi:hypothetical protein
MRATRGGRTVHRVGLATRDGRTDTILYEFPHATPWAVWPRYVLARSNLQGGSHLSVRHALREARLAEAIVGHARSTWPCLRPGPAPDDFDYPDDESHHLALVVFGSVVAASDAHGHGRHDVGDLRY